MNGRPIAWYDLLPLWQSLLTLPLGRPKVSCIATEGTFGRSSGRVRRLCHSGVLSNRGLPNPQPSRQGRSQRVNTCRTDLCVGSCPIMQNDGGGAYLLWGHRWLVGILVILLNHLSVQTFDPSFDLPLRDEDDDRLLGLNGIVVVLSQLIVQSPLTLYGTFIVSVCNNNEKRLGMPSAARSNLLWKPLAHILRAASAVSG